MSGEVVLCTENDRKARPYLEALRMSGVPESRLVKLTPTERPEDARSLAAGAAGLVLAGGPDLDPRHYGEERIAEAGLAVYPELDALDLELIAGAECARTPVWAICRGMQTMNVFLGGTLWQDLKLQVPGVEEHQVGGPLDRIAHGLAEIETESAFGATLLDGNPRVNSRHHQAVKELGGGLRAIAWSPDGVLEVLESESGSDWWIRGVQWHPEDLVALPLQRALWREFVERIDAGAVDSPLAAEREASV